MNVQVRNLGTQKWERESEFKYKCEQEEKAMLPRRHCYYFTWIISDLSMVTLNYGLFFVCCRKGNKYENMNEQVQRVLEGERDF
jgi:hypothetical protein